MRTIKKVTVKPVFVDFMPEFKDMEEFKIYISREYCLAIHRCLCGCGEQASMPLDEVVTETGKFITKMPKDGWILTEKGGKISITPSIGNYSFSCKSHYIITNNVANFV